MTQMINLTPHDINIVDEKGNVTHTFPPSGQIARLDVTTSVVENGDGIPIVKRQMTFDMRTLPEGNVIVSAQVAEHIATRRWVEESQEWDRDDDEDDIDGDETPSKIFTVGDTVKDENGAIIGTKFLVLN